MPIVARCPNPTCGQTLQVPDQYAGMQGKCPNCGTMVTFQPAPAAAAAPAAGPPAYTPPAAPPPAAPPAYTPPAGPDAYTAQAPGAAGTYPPPAVGQVPAPPAGPPMSPQELVQLICVPAGLFFLVLMLIACLVPWAYGGAMSGSTVVVRNLNGIALGEAGIFFVLCLLVTAMVGLTYLFRQALPLAATIAAGFGTFAFFFFLAEVVRFGSHAKAGIWIGLVAALFTEGAFGTLAVFRPLESAALQSLSMPLLRRHGGLALAVACGIVLGLFYLVLTALSGTAAG
jgi:hypothetical protein